MRSLNTFLSSFFHRHIYGKENAYFLLIGVPFLMYVQTFFFGFSYFDDNALILQNLHFLQNPLNLLRSFQTDVFHLPSSSAAYYRPFLTISFMIDSWISGQSAWFYHITNVLIHLVNVVLLYKFLNRLYFKDEKAFWASLIFGIHPVLTQAIAWIPGRNDSLLALFVLVSSLLLLKYSETQKLRFLFFAFLAFFGALFVKETALVLIGILPLLYVVEIEKIDTRAVGITILGVVVALTWFVMRSFVITENIYTPSEIVQTLINNSPAIIQYFGKIMFPFNLSVLPIIQDTSFIPGIATSIILAVSILFMNRKDWKTILLGIIWFLVFLVPSFIRPNSEIVADFLEHWVYVPMIGFIIFFLHIKWEKSGLNKLTPYKEIIFISIAGAFSLITIFHTFQFRNRLSFWRQAVKTSPNAPLAHRNYGAMLYLEGNHDEAENYFRSALELNQNEPMVHNNLGLVYMNKEEYAKAEEYFMKEIAINPLYDDAYFNYGLLKYRESDATGAAKLWQNTLKVNPNHNGAVQNLYILSQETEVEELRKSIQKGLEKYGLLQPITQTH